MTKFDVTLDSLEHAIIIMHDDGFNGMSKLQIIKVVRALTGLDLIEANKLVEETIESLYPEMENVEDNRDWGMEWYDTSKELD